MPSSYSFFFFFFFLVFDISLCSVLPSSNVVSFCFFTESIRETKNPNKVYKEVGRGKPVQSSREIARTPGRDRLPSNGCLTHRAPATAGTLPKCAGWLERGARFVAIAEPASSSDSPVILRAIQVLASSVRRRAPLKPDRPPTNISIRNPACTTPRNRLTSKKPPSVARRRGREVAAARVDAVEAAEGRPRAPYRTLRPLVVLGIVAAAVAGADQGGG